MKVKFKKTLVHYRQIVGDTIVDGTVEVVGKNTNAARKRAIPDGAIIDEVENLVFCYSVDNAKLEEFCKEHHSEFTTMKNEEETTDEDY